MLEFRMEIEGNDDVACYLHEVTVELSTDETAEGSGTVVARCGKTLTMYVILPVDAIGCDESVFGLHLEIMVQGIGTVGYDLQLMGGGAVWC